MPMNYTQIALEINFQSNRKFNILWIRRVAFCRSNQPLFIHSRKNFLNVFWGWLECEIIWLGRAMLSGGRFYEFCNPNAAHFPARGWFPVTPFDSHWDTDVPCWSQSGGGKGRRSKILHDACDGSWSLHCFGNKWTEWSCMVHVKSWIILVHMKSGLLLQLKWISGEFSAPDEFPSKIVIIDVVCDGWTCMSTVFVDYKCTFGNSALFQRYKLNSQEMFWNERVGGR